MKHFILSLVLMLSSLSTYAIDPFFGAITTTVAVGAVVEGHSCVAKDSKSRFGKCYLALTSSSVVVAAFLKEDIAVVKPDAYDFLAGEEISLALEDQMERVRQEIPEAQNMTNEEVALLMLQITEMQ